jgi:hypothetical protein
MEKSKSSKFITPLAKISYPWIATPQPAEDGKKPKYSCTLIFLPEILAIPAEKALFDAMQAAGLALVNGKWGERAALMLKSDSFKKGFRKDGESKGYPEGSIFINVRSDNQPGCVYPWAAPGTNKPAQVPQDKIKATFYPGAFVRASVSPFVFDRTDSKGLSFALNNLQFIKDGDRLDNRVAAEDEFTADLSAAPADLEAAAASLI